MAFSRSTIVPPKLSRKAFVWLAEIIGSAQRDGIGIAELASRLANVELPPTNPGFRPDQFMEAVREFSK